MIKEVVFKEIGQVNRCIDNKNPHILFKAKGQVLSPLAKLVSFDRSFKQLPRVAFSFVIFNYIYIYID